MWFLIVKKSSFLVSLFQKEQSIFLMEIFSILWEKYPFKGNLKNFVDFSPSLFNMETIYTPPWLLLCKPNLSLIGSFLQGKRKPTLPESIFTHLKNASETNCAIVISLSECQINRWHENIDQIRAHNRILYQHFVVFIPSLKYRAKPSALSEVEFKISIVILNNYISKFFVSFRIITALNFCHHHAF